MAISRRQLVKLGALSAGLSGLSLTANTVAQVKRRRQPSIIQGATDSTRTQFSIVHERSQSLLVSAESGKGQRRDADYTETILMADQTSKITKAYFSQLELSEQYTLTVTDKMTGETLDQRQFRMLNDRKSNLKFAVCSCMDDFNHTPDIWIDLVRQKPDFIIFAGDSVYCDKGEGDDAGPMRLWRRFAESRATLEIYFSEQLIPILATWDDHDFGLNDAGRDFPHLAASQKNFLNFYALNPEFCSALERGPGVSSRIAFQGQQFLLMDDRSWRMVGDTQARYGHWGQEQEEWLINNVKNFEGFTWIVNGSQIFPQLVFKQSFSGDHPVQFNAIKKALKNLKNRRVGILTGDVHYSEVSQIEPEAFGYGTYELTSSSIHSHKFPGLPDLAFNSRRVASSGEHNYLLVESQPMANGCSFRVESRSPMDIVNFSLDLSI